MELPGWAKVLIALVVGAFLFAIGALWVHTMSSGALWATYGMTPVHWLLGGAFIGLIVCLDSGELPWRDWNFPRRK